MRILAALLLVLVLSGSTCQRRAELPIPASCNPMCRETCASRARWEGNAEDPGAWDSLASDTLGASRAETRECEVRRKACDQCIQRLVDAGVLTW
jgi:hypothetical protein